MARTKKGTPPSYRFHKATGQAIVTVSGRDIYLGEFGSEDSIRQYAFVIAGELPATKKKQRTADANEPTTLVEVLAAFWKHAQTYYVKNGEPTNEIAALRIVIRDAKTLFGHEPVDEFGPKKLKAVRQLWIDRGQARTTINKNTRRLTRIIRWGVSEEMVSGGVLESLCAVPGLKKHRCTAREPDPVKPVSMEAVEATIPYMPPVLADMVRFQLLTGSRPGEVCRMRPKDINRDGEVWEYHDPDHKTEHHGRNRTVFIGPEAQAVLRPYLLRDATSVCFSMAESLWQRRRLRNDARTTPLSCGNRAGKRSNADRRESKPKRKAKERFDANSYRQAIHHACDAAFDAPEPLGRREGESNIARMKRLTEKQREELDAWRVEHRWNANQLRHTRGTEIRKRFGLEAAQVILGHAAADVTQVYAERDRDKAIEVARQVG
ncbi:tyrosine-type recombinase/integrase [Rhodopirellula sp. SWK7]|uniref:tyrosine-type recombinase/integrase n=1 Tax=Rhodopirellula sp. SWK7 TaxID=595460 RepID=UPI0002BE526D|nr:site-specific integrase [Rhodopirellula sp. SWK7]EMI42471.1 hypothetical protein RRSWK_05083 [Rhodopirellula sp. SWK7]